MRLFSVLAVIISFVALFACTKDVGPNPDLVVRIVKCDTITFSKDVRPIIQANCVSCHQPGGPGLIYGHADYQTDMYAGLKTKVDNGELLTHAIDLTASPTMPYGMDPLPELQREILRCWVNAGAPNN